MLRRTCFLMVATIATSPFVFAQEPEFPGPEPEHAFLAKLKGKWETKAECIMGPGQAPVKTESVITAKMVGPYWVVSEIDAEAMGQKVKAIQTIGYDAEKKKYVGTWIDSMLGHMWHYEGTVDKSGKKLVLYAEGPNFMTGQGTAKFRDTYEFETDDHVVATSSVQGEDGKWTQFVTGHTKRVSGE